MTKVEFVSDLHNEAYRQKSVMKRKDLQPYSEYTKQKDTVLVLAGDIDNIKRAIALAISLCPHYLHVILTPGNHEYWNHRLDKDYMPARVPSNFSMFDDGSEFIMIDDVLFAGATLWTDYDKHNPLCIYDAKATMADQRFILHGPSYSKVRAEDLCWIHEKHKSNLKKVIDENEHNKLVVVTHHSPSFNSDLRGGNSAYYYHCTDMDDLIAKTDLWIHGHTHDNVDYPLLDCRVVANCYGYPLEHHRLGNDFKPGWTIKL